MSATTDEAETIVPDPLRADGFLDIEDYGVISDQRCAALVGRDGGIDWLCVPRFDDPPVFARLLDPKDGGYWDLCPTEPFTVERCYVEDTNVLQTTMTTASGVVRITDALIVAQRIQRFTQLARKVECVSGEVELRWVVRPRFGWQREPGRHRAVTAGDVFSHGHLELLIQALDLGDPEVAEGEVHGQVRLSAGEDGVLSMMAIHAFPLLAASRDGTEQRLQETCEYWHAWLAPLDYDGPWERQVRRSLLALATCVHDETGAMVAAPTTSLPEKIGGSRNFDYRYCWIRDTAFALDAALRLGLTQLAQATMGWLLRSEAHTHPRINVFFTLGGDPFRPQQQVDLPGYRGSRPVLDGNSAGSQLQLGCFGDLMVTAWIFVEGGNSLDSYASLHLGEVADHICEIWRNPDSGIWELGDKRDYTHSKVQCWTTLDRALKLHERGEVNGGHPDRWGPVKEEIGAWIHEHCRDSDGVFLRDGNGSGELDCGVLLLPRSHFVAPDDPGFLRTIDRIRDELGAGNGLLYRYSGMREEENAFVACSFWMVEALARVGRLDEARELMDELLGLENDLGLISEEVDPTDGGLRGNFPQALSHLSLLNAAAVYRDEAGKRSS